MIFTGYMDVGTIPSGARGITIRETPPSTVIGTVHVEL